MEAIDSNIYEAFLESAPQVLFQLLALLNFDKILQGKQKDALVNYFSQTNVNYSEQFITEFLYPN